MDRITRVRIKNVRAIEYVELDLSRPLTVLIGENGAGKSTIIECLELLRKAAEPGFVQQFYSIHRGMPGLLRKGASAIELAVVIKDDAGKLPDIDYSFTLAKQLAGVVVQSERLLVGPMNRAEKPLIAVRRTADRGEMFDQKEGKLVPVPREAMKHDQLVVASFGNLPPQKAIERLLRVLGGIEVHLPFDTRASWGARSYQRPESLRVASTLFPADRLNLLAFNLANAWSELRNCEAAHWDHTMSLARLGLGDRVDSVVITADHGGGNVYLALRFTDLTEPVLAADLSDGQLSWLAFVAMVRLNPGRSFLAVDEPELHLHPHLLGGVAALLKRLDVPVLLATHADRVLELLDDPAEAVRVCALDERGHATASRVDATELPKWIEHYGDFSRLRAAGYLSRVLLPAPVAPAEEAE
jgi:predicted ATPase